MPEIPSISGDTQSKNMEDVSFPPPGLVISEYDFNSKSNLKLFQFTCETLNIAITEYDFDTNKGKASRFFLEYIGLTIEDIESSYEIFLSMIHPDDVEYFHKETFSIFNNQNRESKRTVTLKLKLLFPNDEIKYCRFISTVYYHEDFTPKNLINIIQDITEEVLQAKHKEELQKKLEQSDKMSALGQLVSGISHDFNNILCSIISGAEYFSENSKLTKSEKESADNIVKAGLHAADLTRQLLTFSKQSPSQLTLIKLNELARSAIAILEKTLNKDIELITAYSTDDLSLFGDYARLQASILNIFVNAADALNETEKPSIKLTTRLISSEAELPAGHNLLIENEEYAMLTIANNGSLIPEEERDKIFDPFYSTKKNAERIGLGLAMVYSTVKSANGQIYVDSNAKETSFNIYLPLVNTIFDSKNNSEQVITGSGRILFTDDDKYARNNLSHVISNLGYTVDQAENAHEAIKLYREYSYDLVITDMAMPEVNGIELFNALKEINPEVKVIILSATALDLPFYADSIEDVELYLSKPISKQQLSQALHTVLSNEEG